MYKDTFQIVIDVVLLVMVVSAVLVGIKRGFFRSIMRIVIVVAAIAAAYFGSGYLQTPVTEWVYPYVENGISKAVESYFNKEEETPAETGSGAVSSLFRLRVYAEEVAVALGEEDASGENSEDAASVNTPLSSLLSLAEQWGISEDTLREFLKQAGVENADSLDFEDLNDKLGADIGQKVTEFIGANAKTILKSLVRVSLFFVIFLLVWSILAIAVNGINALLDKIPFVGTANKVLGAILNAAALLLFVFAVLACLLHFGVDILEEEGNGTILLKLLIKYNPVKLFLHW